MANTGRAREACSQIASCLQLLEDLQRDGVRRLDGVQEAGGEDEEEARDLLPPSPKPLHQVHVEELQVVWPSCLFLEARRVDHAGDVPLLPEQTRAQSPQLPKALGVGEETGIHGEEDQGYRHMP